MDDVLNFRLFRLGGAPVTVGSLVVKKLELSLVELTGIEPATS